MTDQPVTPPSAVPSGIDVTNPAIASQSLRALIGTGTLAGFLRRGTEIVHTPREGEDGYIPPAAADAHDGPAQVRPVTPSFLASAVSWKCLTFRVAKGTGLPYPARFPAEVATDAVNLPEHCPNLRMLRGVTHTPIVRADGSILTAPGYDASSGYLYLPPPGLAIPAVPFAPSVAEVSASLGLLSAMVADFPWITEGDRVNYLGFLLSPLLRQLLPAGSFRLAAFTAPQPASGKTLLVQAAHILHGGVLRAEVPREDAELRKQITAVLSSTTAPVVTFDNVHGQFRSAVLEGLLTSPVWTDRVLGASRDVSLPNDRVWSLTGNNISIGGDLARRTLWVSIDADRPDPQNRTDFAIADLPVWVATLRPVLLRALLVLVAHWVASGRPLAAASTSDSFTTWIRTVGGILGAAGIAVPFADPGTVRAVADVDDDEWAELLVAIEAVKGVSSWTVRQVLEHRETETVSGLIHTRLPVVDALPSELTARIRNNDPSVIAKSLGRWLMNRAGRWAGGRCVRMVGRDRSNVVLWRIEVHHPQGVHGVSGYSPTPSRSFQGNGAPDGREITRHTMQSRRDQTGIDGT